MKSMIFMIVLSSIGLCYGDSADACKLYPDCIRCNEVTLPLKKVGDHYYYIELNTKGNWYSAAQFCNFHGTGLVSIESQKENQDLSDYLTSIAYPSDEHVWSSGTDLSIQSKWFWFSNGKHAAFTSWSPGQPDNAGGNEHCIEISLRNGTFGWNDLICTREHPFICEVY